MGMGLLNRGIWVLLLAASTFFNCQKAVAQYEPMYAQYYQNQLVNNPAFTGFRNTLATDFSIRKQWMGFEGAPTTNFIAAHSPLNNTKTSLGAYIHQWQAGPLNYSHVSASYSHIVRIHDRMLLSLGMNVGVMTHKIPLDEMVLLDSGDPYFQNPLYREVMPTTGVGAVLFTPLFYVGLSKPSIVLAKINLEDNAFTNINPLGHLYAMGGISLPEFSDIKTKISLLGRWASNGTFVLDNTIQMFYDDIIGVGFTYRPGNSGSAMLSLQASKNWGFTYTYDFPLAQTNYVLYGSHEITISYDCFAFYKRNKYRVFKRKKEPDPSEFRSIRFF
jgi:type IX secretion system PorP/SprF family membrane protein